MIVQTPAKQKGLKRGTSRVKVEGGNGEEIELEVRVGGGTCAGLDGDVPSGSLAAGAGVGGIVEIRGFN